MSTHAAGRRSLMKAMTFRIMIICSDFLIIYLLTHRLAVATGLVLATNFASTTLYFFHERLWDHIQWGRTAETAGHVELIQAILNKKKNFP